MIYAQRIVRDPRYSEIVKEVEDRMQSKVTTQGKHFDSDIIETLKSDYMEYLNDKYLWYIYGKITISSSLQSLLLQQVQTNPSFSENQQGGTTHDPILHPSQYLVSSSQEQKSTSSTQQNTTGFQEQTAPSEEL